MFNLHVSRRSAKLSLEWGEFSLKLEITFT